MYDLIDFQDTIVTPPTTEPVTLAFARKHTKAISTAEDELLETWLVSGREVFEEETGRQVITAIRERWLDAFPYGGKIELPFPPLQEVLSVSYINANGDLVSFDEGDSPGTPRWRFQAPQGTFAGRGYVEPKSGLTWPIARAEGGAVRIRYRCGYGDAPASVPALIKSTICLLASSSDQFRSEQHLAPRSTALVQLPFGAAQAFRRFKYTALPQMVLRRSAPTCP